MKYLFLVVFVCLFVSHAYCQFNAKFSTYNSKSINIDFLYGDITIQQHDIDEIHVDGSFIVNGKDFLDQVTIDTKKANSNLTLFLDVDLSKVNKTHYVNHQEPNQKNRKNYSISSTKIDAKFTIKIPKNTDLSVNTTYGSIEIYDYWKNMEVNGIYGSIDAVLIDLPIDPSFSIKSTYNSVDLTIQENINATINMQTDYGKIYSDLNFKADFAKNNPTHGQKLSTSLNKGLGDITMVATYDNIYLRKSK